MQDQEFEVVDHSSYVGSTFDKGDLSEEIRERVSSGNNKVLTNLNPSAKVVKGLPRRLMVQLRTYQPGTWVITSWCYSNIITILLTSDFDKFMNELPRL